jgi:uncharacterized membrane protein
VASRWNELPEREARFSAAPGDQGTEIVVELEYTPDPIAKLRGEDPPTKLADELRRFKQLVETGEVARA